MYCRECGTEVDGKFCQECGTPVNPVQNGSVEDNQDSSNSRYLKSEDFKKWAQGTGVSLIIWGILNLFWAPYFGIMLLFFGILIYILKLPSIITTFGAIWLIVALYQLYIGLFLIEWYLFLALVNGIFSIFLLYKVNKFANRR